MVVSSGGSFLIALKDCWKNTIKLQQPIHVLMFTLSAMCTVAWVVCSIHWFLVSFMFGTGKMPIIRNILRFSKHLPLFPRLFNEHFSNVSFSLSCLLLENFFYGSGLYSFLFYFSYQPLNALDFLAVVFFFSYWQQNSFPGQWIVSICFIFEKKSSPTYSECRLCLGVRCFYILTLFIKYHNGTFFPRFSSSSSVLAFSQKYIYFSMLILASGRNVT